jgi:hypothetical protein
MTNFQHNEKWRVHPQAWGYTLPLMANSQVPPQSQRQVMLGLIGLPQLDIGLVLGELSAKNHEG